MGMEDSDLGSSLCVFKFMLFCDKTIYGRIQVSKNNSQSNSMYVFTLCLYLCDDNRDIASGR